MVIVGLYILEYEYSVSSDYRYPPLIRFSASIILYMLTKKLYPEINVCQWIAWSFVLVCFIQKL